MRRATILSFALAIIAPSYAVPTLNARIAEPGSIASQCINTEFRDQWFVGECLTGVDSTTRIQSAVDLKNKLSNDNGDLVFKSGGLFQQSCWDCILADTAILSCQCRPEWGSGKTGMQTGIINLDGHISVYNGHLLSNLTSTPEVPSSASEFPVPSRFTYQFGGASECLGADGPGKDYCKEFSQTCESKPKTDTSDTNWIFSSPITCYVPYVYYPEYHYQLDSLRVAGEGEWEVWGYFNEDCSGEPVKLDPAIQGECQAFETPIRAISARPAFNGDPN
ncbi:hypothetical protein BS50DRAFT_677781 [Corynespora cassiicola Philippines]|uniref:Cyanovirin-N domain-containing protein n=1 Tax=Corynespora cassiicola Philippines TaxID=1448308 RepID=A0A2T2NHN8_CORCC|nr:hypothetical protein BS50DRAFT_677781 [Corynespora cassiicola Philippines]